VGFSSTNQPSARGNKNVKQTPIANFKFALAQSEGRKMILNEGIHS